MLFIEILIATVLLLLPAWRILGRAGFQPLLSLIVLIPIVGLLTALAILAFGDWPARGGPGRHSTPPPGRTG